MIVSAVARRYAKAVLRAAMTARREDEILAELESLAEALSGSPVVRAKLRDPVLPRKRKTELVKAVLDAWKPSELTARLLLALAENGRMHLVPEVGQGYREELDRARGIVEAEVTSATPLDARSRSSLERALRALTSKSVRIIEKSDPSILGGVVARIGGIAYDASVVARIEKMRATLAGE